MPVFYICDRQACGKNHDCGRCRHTKKIEHAINFQPSTNKHSANFYEKEKNAKKSLVERMFFEEFSRINITIFNTSKKSFGCCSVHR